MDGVSLVAVDGVSLVAVDGVSRDDTTSLPVIAPRYDTVEAALASQRSREASTQRDSERTRR